MPRNSAANTAPSQDQSFVPSRFSPLPSIHPTAPEIPCRSRPRLPLSAANSPPFAAESPVAVPPLPAALLLAESSSRAAILAPRAAGTSFHHSQSPTPP